MWLVHCINCLNCVCGRSTQNSNKYLWNTKKNFKGWVTHKSKLNKKRAIQWTMGRGATSLRRTILFRNIHQSFHPTICRRIWHHWPIGEKARHDLTRRRGSVTPMRALATQKCDSEKRMESYHCWDKNRNNPKVDRARMILGLQALKIAKAIELFGEIDRARCLWRHQITKAVERLLQSQFPTSTDT